MPYIHLTTFIAAPAERVFDLSRSISLHQHSMQRYKEVPVGELRTGLMKEGDVVTWQARHLLKERKLKVKITSFNSPYAFTDEQVEGDFVMMKHEHYFKPIENGMFMIDQFWFEIPYGIMGKWLNRLYLTRHMERLLEQRNSVIKQVAESNEWKKFLQ